ncbi:PSD1 and planctomycete cytochrome C domain-containing protein [Rhodopirellula sp. P2]|uniref:PSD1 and planctomycete cytochrome C domain-containing protein n=1 Tax=Rhodopirellula sp. P2 TaxID=2127060 RepID=UPI002367EF3E|nr:PSD1 and planctomycete cytochrome C domain-containing protein [Rhodopirellula sp. P2]WDQ18939.1 PSD1 and planctomycete cytochrome C domain-containing protein [Rhodopirellula sp. P2]
MLVRQSRRDHRSFDARRPSAIRSFFVWNLSLSVAASLIFSGGASADELDFFEAKVRPLLIERCYECHSSESGESMGDYRLDSAPAMKAGGSRGASIVPGDADASVLVRAISYEESGLEMPPDEKLSDEEIAILKHWIESGAVDPREEEHSVAESLSPLERDVNSHWAFVAPTRVSGEELRASHVATDANSRDLVDDLSAKHAGELGVSVNEIADRDTLLRRLHFDLSGLPPTYEQLQAFREDRRPDAFQRRVNQMLADPRMSERMGRHWLDVARYADTIGYTTAGKERTIKGSHRYRDWVLKAFAEDMPFDEMVRHQLAGDRTDPKNENGNADAMGFITIGRKFLSNDDTLDDRIDVITRGLLGLTVSCARCHDHKFDPIPTMDYYSLYNVLNNSVPPEDLDAAPSPLMLVDRDKLRGQQIYIRGQRGNRGEEAPRQYLTAFRKPEEPQFETGSGRLDLAMKVISPDNPLTARVYVNRMWGHLTGRPLVDSPSDFGFRTPAPAIPGVLDDFAVDFQTHWSTQRLIRRILATRIYQQSSAVSAEALASDPTNAALARAERRRREFESLRDSILVGANLMDCQYGGESVEITSPTVTPRRTLYAMINRQNLPGLFRTFDFASPDMHSPERYETTVPQQALFLLNHPQLASAALATARDVGRASSGEPVKQVTELFQRLLQREPTASELEQAVSFVSSAELPPLVETDPRELWTYGTATWKDDQLEGFTAFPTFQKNGWQIESEYPSPGPFSYARLTNEGGHPAHGDSGAVVRRWKSPVDGVVKVTGMVGHRSKQGDGIQAIIRIGGEVVFNATQLSNDRPVASRKRRIRKGEFVEFITHSGPTPSFDTFFWRAKISARANDGAVVEANSVDDFSGPFEKAELPHLDRLAQLAQVLFLTNEFAFVD